MENIITFTLILVFLFILIISFKDIIKQKLNSNKTEQQDEKIQERLEIEEL